MKNLFVFWSLALSGVLFSSVLQGKQFTIWHQKEKATEVFQTLLKPLEQEFGVTFSVSYIATNDLKSALITSALSQRQPDLVLVPSDFFGDYKNFKFTAIPEAVKNTLPIEQGAWLQSKINGRYYGIPLYIGNHLLLYYNKSIIDTPAASWQQLVNQQSLLMPEQQLIGWNYNELFWFIHFASGFQAFPVVNGRVNLNTPKFADALTFYRQLSHSGIISQSCNYDCSSKRFANGDFAYALNGDWAYRDLKSTLGKDLGIAALPSIQGTPMKSYYSTLNLAFPGHREETELDQLELAIIQKLLNEQSQKTMFEQLSLLPTTPAARKALNVSDEYKPVLTTLEQAIPLPSSASMSAAWAGMRKGLDYFLAHNASASRTCQIMQKVAERELSRIEEGQ